MVPIHLGRTLACAMLGCALLAPMLARASARETRAEAEARLEQRVRHLEAQERRREVLRKRFEWADPTAPAAATDPSSSRVPNHQSQDSAAPGR